MSFVKKSPGEIDVMSNPVPDSPELQSTVINDLDLSIDDMLELVKNPVRSIINAIFASLEKEEYGVAKEIHTRREINPLNLKIFFSMSKHLTIDPETNELSSFGVASIAMHTCFGPISFTIDVLELELLKENERFFKSCEDTATGRAIVGYIYDELSNINNDYLTYDNETKARIYRYLHR